MKEMELLGKAVPAKEQLTAHSGQLGQIERLQMITHDMRTLLMAVRGFAHLIRSSAEKPELVHEYSDDIKDATDRLRHLINEIDGRDQVVQPPVTEVAPVVRSVFDALAPFASDQHHLETRLADSLPLVKADAESLHRILFNLGTNAIKYSPMGGRIVIAAERHDGEVELVVADEGVGIASDSIDRIFEFAFRAGNAAEVGGDGLGLSVVKQIVEEAQGRGWVESKPGPGSSFHVTVPSAA